jgi:hypothetical protein
VNPLRNVTEQSVDEALRDVAHRRKMARLLHDDCAVLVLTRQLDRLLDLKLGQRHAPMIHR